MNFKRTMLKTVAATVFTCLSMGSAMAADITGEPRNALYERALLLKQGSGSED